MVDPVLQAELAKPVTTLAFIIELGLASTAIGRDIYLIDGSAEVTIGGHKYVGIDADFGTIDAVDSITDGNGEEAPEISVSFLPSGATAAATLCNPLMQGCMVKISAIAIDPTTGLAVGTPEVKFLGEIDVPTLTVEQGKRSLEFTIVSIFERLFEIDDGVRMSDGFHQSIWETEIGFSGVTNTDKNLYWGATPPPRINLTALQTYLHNIQSPYSPNY